MPGNEGLPQFECFSKGLDFESNRRVFVQPVGENRNEKNKKISTRVTTVSLFSLCVCVCVCVCACVLCV